MILGGINICIEDERIDKYFSKDTSEKYLIRYREVNFCIMMKPSFDFKNMAYLCKYPIGTIDGIPHYKWVLHI